MTRWSIRWQFSLQCGVPLLLAACSSGVDNTGSALVRDSAGVIIVQNPGDIWSTTQARQLSAEPALRIGAADGDEPYLFDGIRGIASLSDGRIVVANGGSASLRWFDPEGGFLFERGGSGEGPGEFSRLGGITRSGGDTIVVVDWSARRAVTFAPDGTHAITTTLLGLPGPPGVVFRLSDGSFIAGVSGFSSSQFGPNPEPGILRLPVPMVRVPPDAASVDTLGQFLGTEVSIQVEGRGMFFVPPPFAKSLHYAVADDQLYIGTAERFAIDVYSADGRLLRSIRAPDVDLQLSDEVIEAYREHRRSALEELSEQQRAVEERRITALAFPESLPAYTSLLVDHDGRLWVGEHVSVPARPRRWAIFDSDGRLIELVETPPRFIPLEITGTFIWGRATDDLGVQYVVAYAFEPSEATPP